MAMIKLRVRSNDILAPNTLTNNEWILFDEATEIRFGQKQFTDKTGFKALAKAAKANGAAVTHTMLREDLESGELHYNSISWVDRITREKHTLVFDTMAFIQNAEGKTLEKVEG